MSDLFMTPNEVEIANMGDDGMDLVIPTSFKDALSYAQQIIWLYLHKQNTLVEGENITLTDNPDGTTTISASGSAIEARGIKSIEGIVGPTGTTVVVTLTDDTTQTFFVERGPEGPQGEQGVQGEQGPAGQPGEQGPQGETGPQGPAGPTGAQGPSGDDGVSPEITITSITGGHRVTITDKDHPLGQTIDIMDGSDGAQGPQGPQGPAGPQGPQGADGDPGQDGAPGAPGKNGNRIWTTTSNYTTPNYTFDINDLDGQSGETPLAGDYIVQNVNSRTFLFFINSVSTTTVLADYFCELTGATGAAGATGATGPQGPQGPAGTNGTDGVSPTVTVTSITGGHHIEIVSAGGTEYFDVMDGTDGAPGPSTGAVVNTAFTMGSTAGDLPSGVINVTPTGTSYNVFPVGVKLTSGTTTSSDLYDGYLQKITTQTNTSTRRQLTVYYRDTVNNVDKSTMLFLVPTGGSNGQVLTKNGSSNNAYGWATPRYVSSGGSDGQVLQRSGSTAYGWFTPRYVPTGGSSGQVLQKTGSGDTDFAWATPSSGGVSVTDIPFTSGTYTGEYYNGSAWVSPTSTSVDYTSLHLVKSGSDIVLCKPIITVTGSAFESLIYYNGLISFQNGSAFGGSRFRVKLPTSETMTNGTVLCCGKVYDSPFGNTETGKYAVVYETGYFVVYIYTAEVTTTSFVAYLV